MCLPSIRTWVKIVAWALGVPLTLFVTMIVFLRIATNSYWLYEKKDAAQFDRCIAAGVCRMDCAVIVHGPGANPDVFLRHNTKSCVLTDEHGKLKEIYSEHED